MRVATLRDGAALPRRAYDDDAGLDLAAAESAQIAPGGRATVGCGIAIELPQGCCALVVPRSGLAARHGITVLNGPGLIDAGYRGEVRVTLHNTDSEAHFTVEPGMRIAQLLVLAPAAFELVEADALAPTERGERGFGSSDRVRLRAPAPADAPAVSEVINAHARELDGVDSVSAQTLIRWWGLPGLSVELDIRVAMLDGVPAAYCDVQDVNEDGSQIWIDLRAPSAAHATGAARALVAWAAERAHELVASDGLIRALVDDRDTAEAALFDELGFTAVRNSYRLQVDLPEDAPHVDDLTGFAIRLADAGAESRAVFDLKAAAFAGAWGANDEPYESWCHDWGVADDLHGGFWLVAEAADGALGGICLCRAHDDGDPRLGYVGILAVNEGARRRGLGRALLQAAFACYHARGMRRVGLGVDAGNETGALALYEGVGMRPVRRQVSLELKAPR